MKREAFYQCLTEFIFIEDKPQEADLIFVPGGNYPDAAQYAARLYAQGWAPYVLPSGRYSILTGRFERNGEHLFETEWDYLKDILMREGVPEDAILREDQATYTYENAVCSRKRVDELGLSVRKAILCCQAFHARRSLMYYQEQFPETEFLVCPVVTRGISKENWFLSEHGIDTVLGEVERCGSQFHEIMKAALQKEKQYDKDGGK